MGKRTSPLDNVRVAAPCSAGWENMVGTERVRFCGQCSLNVYNLSAMTKKDAEQLIAQAEGRLCVRYYQRRDGTILTKNCPVGLRALRRRLTRVAGASASAVLGFFAGLFSVAGLRERTMMGGIGLAPVEVNERLSDEGFVQGNPIRPIQIDVQPVMGTYAMPKENWVEGRMTIKRR